MSRNWIAGAGLFALTLCSVCSFADCKQKPCVVEFPISRSDAEALQRSVSHGHQPWLLQSRAVADEAIAELDEKYERGLYVTFSKVAVSHPNLVTCEYSLSDGSRRFEVTVNRFDWLLPVSKRLEWTIWIPTKIVIDDGDVNSGVP